MAQLDLELGDARARVPWGGQSPRSLTRVAILLSSQRERAGDVQYVDPAQYDLFDRGAGQAHKRSFIYEGAPLLVSGGNHCPRNEAG